MQFIAHRGMGTNKFCPEGLFENTLDSFAKAFSIKEVLAVETDLRKTKNGILICHHDHFIGKQLLKDLTYNDVLKLRPYVPTLEEVLKKFPNHKFIFELKPEENNEEIVREVFDKYITKLNKNNFRFISFCPEYLTLVKSFDKEIYCIWIATSLRNDPKRIHPFITKKDIDFCVKNNIEEIAGDDRGIFRYIINYAKSKGVKVGVGMTNTNKLLQRAVSKSYDYVYTDKCFEIIETFKSIG